MRKMIVLISIFACSCCNTIITEDFNYLISPDRSQCITFVNRSFLSDCECNKNDSGIFLYYGNYQKGDTLPNEYLKVDFDDDEMCSIQWTEPIVFSYKHISENKIDSKDMIIVEGFKLFDSIKRKNKLIYGKNAERFFLDNIFNNEIESLRKRIRKEN